MPAKTTDLTNAIFEFIKANRGVTVKEISEQLDKPCRGVKAAVSNLTAKEKIVSDFTRNAACLPGTQQHTKRPKWQRL